MPITVIDSGNLEQIMTHEGVEADLKPAESVKTEVVEPKTADKLDAEDQDDVEGEDGTTERQRRELSAKMLKAIGKKHRQVKEAEEFAAHQYREKQAAEARAAELESRLKELQAQSKQAEVKEEEVEPKRENFDTEGEYIDAKIKWGINQGIAKREAERLEAERQLTVAQQIARATELIPDFEQVTSAPLNWPQGVAAYLRESPMFAELGYHFAKNPDQLQRLAKLPPLKQLVDLGKIEATLKPFGSSESSPKAGDEPNNGKAAKAAPSAVDTGFTPSKARSDAPVIKPLNGEGAQVEPDVRDMDVRHHIAEFQKTNKVNLHARKRH